MSVQTTGPFFLFSSFLFHLLLFSFVCVCAFLVVVVTAVVVVVVVVTVTVSACLFIRQEFRTLHRSIHSGLALNTVNVM